MESIYRKIEFKKPTDIIEFFSEAVEYRNLHKEESEEVARFVFDATHESKIAFAMSEDLEKIRYEFGALEAPGQPAEGSDTAAYADQLWRRLASLIGAAN